MRLLLPLVFGCGFIVTSGYYSNQGDIARTVFYMGLGMIMYATYFIREKF